MLLQRSVYIYSVSKQDLILTSMHAPLNGWQIIYRTKARLILWAVCGDQRHKSGTSSAGYLVTTGHPVKCAEHALKCSCSAIYAAIDQTQAHFVIQYKHMHFHVRYTASSLCTHPFMRLRLLVAIWPKYLQSSNASIPNIHQTVVIHVRLESNQQRAPASLDRFFQSSCELD